MTHVLRNENFDRPQYARALSLLDDAAPGKGTVLEIGSGRGEFARLLVERGYEVLLTDVNRENMDWAQSQGLNAQVLDANAPLAALGNAAFNGSVLLEVIEHIPRAEQLLRELHRVLKPGGWLLLSTPNPYFLWRRLGLLAGGPISGEGYHYRFFDYRLLRRILSDAGFHIDRERHATTGFGLNAVRRLVGKPSAWIPLPRFCSGLLARKFYLLARKT